MRRRALPTVTAPARRERRFGRAPLAIKLAIAFLGLVAFVLIVNGAVDTYLTYNQAKRAALEVEGEKARGASERVSAFLSEIQTQLGWTTGVEWGYAKLEQQRYDFIRLLRQAPAITALSYIDGKGREQIAVSRLEPDAIASSKDFSADPKFVRAVADKIWFGPVEFRRGSEPYMTVALAHVGKSPGVTVADVNLKLVWDVVSAIHVGDRGFAYVVDDHGRLIAHPDLSLVLRDSDFSKLPQVAEAMKGQSGAAAAAKSFDGGPVLTAFAIEPRTHWAVFVEQPLSEALAAAYATLARAGGLLGLGLLLAAVTGVALARAMAAPIRQLQAGAERLGAGDLTQRLDIRTGDEIEALAGGFNRMAGQLQESYETLEAKVEARTRDLNEALAQQTATAEILSVIAASPDDERPVFEAVAERALRLLDAWSVVVSRFDGDMLRFGASRGGPPGSEDQVKGQFPFRPSPLGLYERCVSQQAPVNVPDLRLSADAAEREYAEMRAFRAVLSVPMLAEDRVIGVIAATHQAVGAFSDDDARLLTSFADQAAIAIRNVSLFNETRESLAQQTATADVLKVISRSAFDLQAVLDTLVASATRLFGAHNGILYLQRDDAFYVRATANPLEFQPIIEKLRARPHTPGRGSVGARVLLTGEIQHVPDLQLDPEYDPALKAASVGRAVLGVPMKRDGAVVGSIVFVRREAGPYSVRQIELAQTFADQAVIAIENARLFDEVQARTRDLEESLGQQTATADVLKVISRSTFNLEAVFEALLRSAVELSNAEGGAICVRNGDVFPYRCVVGLESSESIRKFLLEHPTRPERTTVAGRSLLSGDVEQISDVLADAEYNTAMAGQPGPLRALLSVPLLRDDRAEGAIVLGRFEPGLFSPGQIDLVRTFADQAVIAIENARLFAEVQARTRDLEESLAQQTATAEVLKVISRSAFDLDAIFQTLVATAVDLCAASSGTLCIRDGEVFRYRGMAGPEASSALQQYLVEHPLAAPGRDTVAGRAILSRQTEEIADVLTETDYAVPFAARGSLARALLGVPLIGKTEVLGAIVVARAEPGAFPPRHVEILRTFADQAVIAIENKRLFEEVQARTRELEQSLTDLRKAQDRLVQSEKLASLGQLTAGIAHEIKNPLNFVNNFAALSRELLEELRETLGRLPEDAKADADELMGMIDSNLEKVAHHGKRADSIVKNMLLHSREGSGARERLDVNHLVEEALNLAYHGARAEKPGFNVTIEKRLDAQAGAIEGFAQELTRVLLNLIGNGFYATQKRKAAEHGAYEPTVTATTRECDEGVEIVIRDNGTGIPDEVKAKIFNPFFTTKPAGEGTGLGLSLSHDIVVKQHGGRIEVATQTGGFTEFRIYLPRGGAQSEQGEAE